jgi:hypothetical protein
LKACDERGVSASTLRILKALRGSEGFNAQRIVGDFGPSMETVNDDYLGAGDVLSRVRLSNGLPRIAT